MKKQTKGRAKANARAARVVTRKDDVGRDGVRERLAEVSAARTATAPNKPVKIALLEAERLNAGVSKYKKVLVTLPGFRAADLTLLPELVKALEGTERSWSRTKLAQGSASLVGLRKEAEAWRRQAMAAARYLLRRDERAMLEIERIAEGEGLADLVQDLDDLAVLIEHHAATFAAMPEPLDVAEARRLSKALRKGRDDSDTMASLENRNRAFWALEDAVDEIRAALRFVLRDDPKKLAPLLSRYQADRRAKRRRAASTGAAGAGASNGVQSSTIAAAEV